MKKNNIFSKILINLMKIIMNFNNFQKNFHKKNNKIRNKIKSKFYNKKINLNNRDLLKCNKDLEVPHLFLDQIILQI